jgi:hypothetical protein
VRQERKRFSPQPQLLQSLLPLGQPACQKPCCHVARNQRREQLFSGARGSAVSTGETATQLSDGDEYLDLEHLELGVRQTKGMKTPLGQVISKKALLDKTWKAILAHSALSRTA